MRYDELWASIRATHKIHRVKIPKDQPTKLKLLEIAGRVVISLSGTINSLESVNSNLKQSL